MAINSAPRSAASLSQLERKDNWISQPLLTAIVLIGFVIYSTWRVLENNFTNTFDGAHQHLPLGLVEQGAHYTSPFYALPDFGIPFLQIPLIAAAYALFIPVSFRATCYFCRRTAYRAFFSDPSACGVKEFIPKGKNYTGERQFPFSFVNLHRYTLYLVLILVALHWLHLMEAFLFTKTIVVNNQLTTSPHLGFGVGTFVLLVDTVALTLYVVSCHSFRHVMGGWVTKFSKSEGHRMRFKLWQQITHLNEKHGLYFWVSLGSIWVADLYLRLYAGGLIPDFKVVF